MGEIASIPTPWHGKELSYGSVKINSGPVPLSPSAMHYNFCKLHKTIRVTPAMEAGLTDHVWEIEELLALIE
jgi:hypothetical protein